MPNMFHFTSNEQADRLLKEVENIFMSSFSVKWGMSRFSKNVDELPSYLHNSFGSPDSQEDHVTHYDALADKVKEIQYALKRCEKAYKETDLGKKTRMINSIFDAICDATHVEEKSVRSGESTDSSAQLENFLQRCHGGQYESTNSHYKLMDATFRCCETAERLIWGVANRYYEEEKSEDLNRFLREQQEYQANINEIDRLAREQGSTYETLQEDFDRVDADVNRLNREIEEAKHADYSGRNREQTEREKELSGLIASGEQNARELEKRVQEVQKSYQLVEKLQSELKNCEIETLEIEKLKKRNLKDIEADINSCKRKNEKLESENRQLEAAIESYAPAMAEREKLLRQQQELKKKEIDLQVSEWNDQSFLSSQLQEGLEGMEKLREEGVHIGNLLEKYRNKEAYSAKETRWLKEYEESRRKILKAFKNDKKGQEAFAKYEKPGVNLLDKKLGGAQKDIFNVVRDRRTAIAKGVFNQMKKYGPGIIQYTQNQAALRDLNVSYNEKTSCEEKIQANKKAMADNLERMQFLSDTLVKQIKNIKQACGLDTERDYTLDEMYTAATGKRKDIEEKLRIANSKVATLRTQLQEETRRADYEKYYPVEKETRLHTLSGKKTALMELRRKKGILTDKINRLNTERTQVRQGAEEREGMDYVAAFQKTFQRYSDNIMNCVPPKEAQLPLEQANSPKFLSFKAKLSQACTAMNMKKPLATRDTYVSAVQELRDATKSYLTAKSFQIRPWFWASEKRLHRLRSAENVLKMCDDFLRDYPKIYDRSNRMKDLFEVPDVKTKLTTPGARAQASRQRAAQNTQVKKAPAKTN